MGWNFRVGLASHWCWGLGLLGVGDEELSWCLWHEQNAENV
jgi:hypothetical protein